MIVKNILINGNVNIDPSSSINNLILNDGVKIAKRCSLFGSEENLVEVGENTYIGMNTIINGFNAKVVIGQSVSIAQSVNIMADSGPNASPQMQAFFLWRKDQLTLEITVGLVQTVLLCQTLNWVISALSLLIVLLIVVLNLILL